MNPGALIDISQIPGHFGGELSLTKIVAVPLFSFLLTLTYLQGLVKTAGEGEKPAYSSVTLRALVIAALLVVYVPLYTNLLKGAQLLGWAVLSDEQWGRFLIAALKGRDSGASTLGIMFGAVSSLKEMILFLVTLLAVSCRDVLVRIQSVFLSLLFVFGPIALACGLNPHTRIVLRSWVASSVQVASWSFFLRLLMAVYLRLYPLAGEAGRGIADDYLGLLTVNITFAILIIGVPLVAGTLLSGGSIATLGTAALGAVEGALLVQTMRYGSVVNREVMGLAQASKEQRASWLQHPVSNAARYARQTVSEYVRHYAPSRSSPDRRTSGGHQ